jgi:ubiquinone/menaquinone biosynthesis C-methylase UbiE
MNRYFGTHTLDGEWHALLPRYLLLGDRIRGSRVLDIGCGTGIGSSLLLELGAESVKGVDHRPEIVQLAKVKHDKQGLDFHVMFWEELDFPDDSFDVVVCLDPASPITDPNLLMEVRRVLRDGGEYICALERTKVAGIEGLLPRYGYTSAADQVSIGQSNNRVPQIGELSTYFKTVVSLVQRPHVSYVFEPESLQGGGEIPDSEQMRRVPDDGAEGGIWRSEEKTGADSGPRRAGQWVPVDSHLSSDDAEVAAVEIFFCGDDHLPPPPLREIRLPYYNIVERLEQVIGDLQVRQRLGGEPSSFDEVLDEPAPPIDEDSRTTDEFEVDGDWDDMPTGVRKRPTRPPSAEPARVVELESQLNHLTELYQQVRRDFDQILHQTKAAITERDEYIDHLVQKVHEWEDRLDEDLVPEDATSETGANEFSETATTNVFKVSELRNEDDQPLLDELGSSESDGLDEDSSEAEGLDEDSSEAEGLDEDSSEAEGLDEDSSEAESDETDESGESDAAEESDGDADSDEERADSDDSEEKVEETTE